MWLTLALSPLLLSLTSGMESEKTDSGAPSRFIIACFIQTLLLFFLWDGLIR